MKSPFNDLDKEHEAFYTAFSDNTTKAESQWKVASIGRFFLFLVTLESLFLVATAVFTLAESTNSTEQQQIIYVAVLAIYISCGFFFFAYDSILRENVFQFWASLLCHALITTYVAWHHYLDDLGELFHNYSFAMMIVTFVLQGVYVIMAPYVKDAFGWRLYKRAGIGANLELRKYYKTYSIFFSLLKMDLFMGVLLVLLGYFFFSEPTAELILTSFAMAVTCVWAFLGWRAVRHENRPLLVVVGLLGVIQPAFISFKLWEMWSYPDRFPSDSLSRFAFTGGIALAVRLFLLIWGFWAQQNFGKGLRNNVFEPNSTQFKQPLADASPEAQPPFDGGSDFSAEQTL